MKKSIIAFGILFSVMLTSTNANTNPVKKPVKGKKIVKTTIKNLAPLSIAVAKGDYVMVAKFLEYGSDSNQVSKNSEMTPLMYAARYNNVELIKLLVANGAIVDSKSKVGLTALSYAKHANAFDAVAYLEKL